MRTGLSVSAIAHVSLIALAVIGIGMGRPLEPTPVESIAVDLVPISEFSNIRMGSLNSEIVETETPSVVEDDAPAELAQPTGNTEEDQPTPADTPEPTPAPTEQTAPAPEPAEPVVEPEPEPEPAAPPEPAVRPVVEPVPEPVEAPPPEPEPVEVAPALAVPTETPNPADSAPKPRIHTAALDQKRAEFKRQAEAQKQKAAEDKKKAEEEARKAAEKKKADEQKRIEQARADEAAKIADDVASIINNEESRGATTGAGGEPTLGKETGRSATLSKSEIDGLVSQIRQCMNVPAGAADEGLTAQLEFTIDGAGNVTQRPRIVSSPASTLEQALASAAQRAIMQCGPYAVAGQDVRATFDPREF